jgi:ABC-type taurine transport system ATPase subunit
MVFQSASLFPWLKAIENIEFGPRNIGMREQVPERAVGRNAAEGCHSPCYGHGSRNPAHG